MPTSHSITVPFVPPSGNEYKVPVWNQRRFYVTVEAKSFKHAIAVLWGQAGAVESREFALDVKVYLGKGKRIDVDNSVKCLQDGLAECGAFGNKSDAAIVDLRVRKYRDWASPRTEITVTAL